MQAQAWPQAPGLAALISLGPCHALPGTRSTESWRNRGSEGTNDTLKPARHQQGAVRTQAGGPAPGPSLPTQQGGARPGDSGRESRDTYCHRYCWVAGLWASSLFQFLPAGSCGAGPRPSVRAPSLLWPQGLPSTKVLSEKDGSQRLALAQGDQRCFSDPFGTFLSWNHRTARPQGSACLKEAHPRSHCPCSGPRGALGIRFTRRLLDLITRKSVPHPKPSTLLALRCRNVALADFSATPSCLADTRLRAKIPSSLCTSRTTGQLREAVES